jgi:hypothetical protein
VLAVESSALSVRLAVAASTEAHLVNVRFVQGDAEKVSRGLLKEARRFELLLVDPPRTGAPGLGPLARDLAVRRLSTWPVTPVALARDAAGLTGGGVRLTTLQLVDMFPGTHHSRRWPRSIQGQIESSQSRAVLQNRSPRTGDRPKASAEQPNSQPRESEREGPSDRQRDPGEDRTECGTRSNLSHGSSDRRDALVQQAMTRVD